VCRTEENPDIPQAEKLTASLAAQMTEEEALAILAGYDDPIPD
jgi:hypothetical protein